MNHMRLWKKIALGTVCTLGGVGLVGGVWIWRQVAACDASLSRQYEVAVPSISRSTDNQVIARGKHLAESLSGCSNSDCHGANLAGGRPLDLGPLGQLSGPNITPGGKRMSAYTDGELARLVRHGIRHDKRSVQFMPSHEIGWLPDGDLTAVVSYVRSVPPVDRPDGVFAPGFLAKFLDRRNQFVLDVARHIDHAKDQPATGLVPSPTAEYGANIAKGCLGCHGEHLSGGPIPGAPPSVPVPRNLTPHEAGLMNWTYEQFDKLLQTGIKPDGSKLDPFMPYETLAKMDDIEKRALWAYLRSVPPLPSGQR